MNHLDISDAFTTIIVTQRDSTMEPFPTSCKKKNIQALTLVHSDSYVLVEPDMTHLTTQLVIEKKSAKIIESQRSKKFQFSEVTATQSISLLLGIVKMEESSYLVFAPEVYNAGNFMEHVVYQIGSVELLQLNATDKGDSPEVTMLKAEIKNFFLYGLFFSITCDLSLNYLRMINYTESDSEFNWASHFMKPLEHISQQWKTSVIQGYFGKFSTHAKGLPIDYFLISRRSKHMSGYRSYYRGVDEEGHCANFVESEQVVKVGDRVASHRVIRASTPVFWEQKSASAPIQLTRNKELTKVAFVNHFNALTRQYKRVLCVNLLGKSKEEHVLTRAYEQIFSQSFELFWEILRYQYFDYNEGKKKGEVNGFVDKNSNVLTTFSFDLYDCKAMTVLNEQNGVLRVSCLDGLGRSSELIQKVEFAVLNIIFKELDISLENTVFFKDIYQEIDSDLRKCHQLTRLFTLAWAENRDFLSKLYCGIECATSNLSSLGRKSFFEHIDAAIPLSKPNSDQVKIKCHDMVLGETKILVNTMSSLTQPFNIFICTWNVNDLNPSKLDLHKIFKRIDTCDMLVFAIQEMVELSPNNVLNEENNKAHEWKKVLDSEVQKLPTSYLFLDKVELVGIWMIVYIGTKWKKSVRGVFRETVKTGMGGQYGNKGAGIVRVKVEETMINLINAHLESGQDKMQMRIQNLVDIHQRAFNQNTKGVKNEERIEKCDYKFLIGDLNFRIAMSFDQAIMTLKERHHLAAYKDYKGAEKLLEELLKKDQLISYMRNLETEKCVSGYQEYPIKFDPTYKMEKGEPEYTTKKSRTPSWCDRVLIWTDQPYNQKTYTSLPDMLGSDHRPVIAEYSISISKTEKEDAASEDYMKEFRDSQFQG